MVFPGIGVLNGQIQIEFICSEFPLHTKRNMQPGGRGIQKVTARPPGQSVNATKIIRFDFICIALTVLNGAPSLPASVHSN